MNEKTNGGGPHSTSSQTTHDEDHSNETLKCKDSLKCRNSLTNCNHADKYYKNKN